MRAKRLILRKRRQDGITLFAASAFWLVLAIALGVGGGQAVSGLPALAGLFVPHDFMAAEARDQAFTARVMFTLLDFASQPVSRYSPQVLQPVVAHPLPEWFAANNAGPVAQVPVAAAHMRHPAIAIVIDDLGTDANLAARATALPASVSLSFLPYPQAASLLAHNAAVGGHEVLLHMPMQPEGAHNPGPMALTTGLASDQIRTRLLGALARIADASGINNHEGSRFTSDRNGLVPVVETLADRHLFFLDSRTTPDTEVVKVSRAFGVASAGRDVFLDDTPSAEAVAAQLAVAEARARSEGVVIAIGHPHDSTLSVLAAWCAEAKKRGFDLIPASRAIRLKTERDILNPPQSLAQLR